MIRFDCKLQLVKANCIPQQRHNVGHRVISNYFYLRHSVLETMVTKFVIAAAYRWWSSNNTALKIANKSICNHWGMARN